MVTPSSRFPSHLVTIVDAESVDHSLDHNSLEVVDDDDNSGWYGCLNGDNMYTLSVDLVVAAVVVVVVVVVVYLKVVGTSFQN